MSYSLNDITQSCQAFLIPTRSVRNPEALKILNQTFQAWEQTWRSVSNSTEYQFNADEFYRQNAVLSVVGPDSKILGCHLYSFFDSQNLCNTNFSFYKNFHPSVHQFIESHGLRHLFSMEYLTVTEEFQGNREISLGRFISYLSCTLFKNSVFDGMLARTRDDVHVNKIATELGGDMVHSGEVVNGIPSSSMVFRKSKMKPSPRTEVRYLVDQVWPQLQDHTGLFFNVTSEQNFKSARVA